MECLKVENLFKKYHLGQEGHNQASLRDLIVSGFGKTSKALNASEFYALNDVSFSLTQGTALGIIGRNGAGKSTLLKILSRITSPTNGRVTIKGRVSSLLEVGTGFHPELTGRENIFFNGVILGMKRTEIAQKFDQIVAFSGVEKFLDTPVKRYSSGMLLKLAFSVAAFLEPEILILDEVLAVGDVEFQNKCFKLINELGVSGKTILFVSHNVSALRKLCNKAILLSKGKLIKEGGVNEVIDTYLMDGRAIRSSMQWDSVRAPQDDLIEVQKIDARDAKGDLKDCFNIQDEILITVHYKVKKPGHYLAARLKFFNADGTLLFISVDDAQTVWEGVIRQTGEYASTCIIPKHFFNTGEISVGLEVAEAGIKQLLYVDNAISFYLVEGTTDNTRGAYVGEWPRTAVRPAMQWKTDYSR